MNDSLAGTLKGRNRILFSKYRDMLLRCLKICNRRDCFYKTKELYSDNDRGNTTLLCERFWDNIRANFCIISHFLTFFENNKQLTGTDSYFLF